MPQQEQEQEQELEEELEEEKEKEWTRSNQNHTPCDFCITTSPTSRGIEQNACPW